MNKKITSSILAVALSSSALVAPMLALADNPVPITTGLSMSSTAMGSASFTLAIYGSNFLPDSVVNFNGLARPTQYVSSTQLNATIPASDLATSGNYNVSVTNSIPGGGISNSQVFTVLGANAVPTISSISPTATPIGGSAFTITVNGANFINGSYVRFNGLARTTTFVSPNRVTAIIPAADLAVAGQYVVSVTTPTPGGGTSNALLFTVTGTGTTPNPTVSPSPTPTTPGLPNTGFGPIAQANVTPSYSPTSTPGLPDTGFGPEEDESISLATNGVLAGVLSFGALALLVGFIKAKKSLFANE